MEFMSNSPDIGAVVADGAGRLPVIFMPHGGGPWPLMKDAFGDPAAYNSLEAWLVALGTQYQNRVKAVLVISAHWEETVATVHVGAQPGMLYDYSGFPPESYHLQWPAPGNPALAEEVATLLAAAGFKTGREANRGYDHGTFIPLMLAWPKPTLPVAQLSLLRSLDPAEHFRLGQALEGLRDQGVLIIGSGMSYHNMRGFFGGGPSAKLASEQFDGWLRAAVECPDPAERQRRLVAWESAPSARDCHPRSEHLVPLFVVAGAAGNDPGRVDWSEILMGVAVSGVVFGV